MHHLAGRDQRPLPLLVVPRMRVGVPGGPRGRVACCLAESAEATDEDPELDLYLREMSERLGGLPPDLQRMLDNGFRGSRQGLGPPGQ